MAVDLRLLGDFLPFPFALEEIGKKFPDEVEGALGRAARCPVKFGGAAHVDLLYSLARGIRARRIVETGVAFGWSSLALLLAVEEAGEDARLWSVDLPYFSEWNGDWIGAAVPARLRSRWRLIRAADRQGLRIALRQSGPVDLAHYDSDKSTQGRAYGYGMIWEALRVGGVLVSDDIGDNLAFKEFAERIGRTPIVISDDGKFQGVLIK